MTDRRYRQPLPLGGEDGLPFSKGLMARALIATGLSADRAYELAIAIENDLAARDRPATTLERLEEIALQTLGEEDGATAMQRLLFPQICNLMWRLNRLPESQSKIFHEELHKAGRGEDDVNGPAPRETLSNPVWHASCASPSGR